MTKLPERLALLLSLGAILLTYGVAERVFERLPHIEDEIAYVWQAQAIAGGALTVPSPPEPESFLVPFVVDYEGQRFGKYPLGWPALLAVGVFLNLRALVNPLLAGLAVWLTYRLGERLFSSAVGLLAAGLSLTSPFFLLNSASLLSHPLGLVLSAAFALAWLDAWEEPPLPALLRRRRWLATVSAALALGLLVLTRPLTAVGLCLPFAVHGLVLLARRGWSDRLRLVVFALLVLLVAGLHFAWQYAVTGDALLNPYTLWWEYDKVGFGPGVGRLEGGHTLSQARTNTRFSLRVGWHDLFGWGPYSWIFLPFGALALLKTRAWRGLLVAGVYPSLVLVYLAYWIGSSLFGPRYYYEGLFTLTIGTAAGIALLAGWPLRQGEAWPRYRGWKKARPLLVTALVALLVATGGIFYTPLRLAGMHGLYGISRASLEPFMTPQAEALTPALVVVHPDHWSEYGALLDLQDPFLKTPWLFVIHRGPNADARVLAAFPERQGIDYYPDEPYTLYIIPGGETPADP